MTREADLQLSVGRQPKGERINLPLRIPKPVLDGIDRRVMSEGGGASRNDVIVAACAAYGDFPDGQRPVVVPNERPAPKPRRKSTASKVKTSTPDAPKAGSRLNKKSARGPKIVKAPVPRATMRLGDDEEAVG